MKHLRDQAKGAMANKLARYSGDKDVARVKSGMPDRDGSKGYATGGAVGDMMAAGMPAKGRLDRGGRKKGKPADKKAGTNVNVVVMPKDGGDKGPPMLPPGPPMAGPPMPPPPGPPMPPPGAGPGGPPPPMMRKAGGRVMKHDEGKEDAADKKQDEAMVAKGVHKHEVKMHPGKPMTKLNTGGKVVTAKALVAEKGYQGGGGGAAGRLEKMRKYGK